MEHLNDDDILFYAVGDVAPYREAPHTIFDLVRKPLSAADIAFCQCETNISERGSRLPQARHTVLAHPRTAEAIAGAGFNVVSFAGNHCMDWGREAFSDTISALRNQGIAVVGVGKNISDARSPAILTVKGSKVAFLAYNTILPMGYWAEEGRPGCAPLRAWTVYEQIEHDQPGTPSRIHAFPHREDLRLMTEDVKRARAQADLVIVSMHFGIHFVPAVIAEYQRDMAHAAVDAGADLILGTHAHILKGVEIYEGKAIFYSLCNFALDLPFDEKHAASKGFKDIQKLNPDWLPDFEGSYNFPTDSQKTIIVKCVIRDRSLKSLSFLPVFINKRTAQPEILTVDDSRFQEVVDYLKRISDDQGLGTRFTVKGNEVFLS